MTTLPTRDDGGPSWREIEKQLIELFGFEYCFASQAVHHMKLVAQLTRERCAKVADASPYDCTMADKIRKMEV